MQDLINRYDGSDISYYVIGEVDANAAKMDLLLISPGALIIADIKELTAVDNNELDEVHLTGKQNGPWRYKLPDGNEYPMGGHGKKDNPFQQLERIRYQFAEWLADRSSGIFGLSLNKNQILDRLAAWCVISPGFDGVIGDMDLPWNDIHDKHNWFKILPLQSLSWEFNCASSQLIDFSEKQIRELINQLGATESTNRAEFLPLPTLKRDPFFSKPHLSGSLIDRLSEREKLIRFLENERTSVISLRGLGGVGKTELAAWLAKNAKEENFDVRWIDCSEKEVTDESFLAAIASEIPDRNDAELILNKKTKLPDRMEAALNHLARKPTLIILNDYHKVANKKSLDPLLTHIVHHYSQIKVILTTRDYPGCIDNPRWRPGVANDILIGGLPKDSISEFISLDTDDLPSQDWEKVIFDRTSGNPYALRLVSAIARRNGWGEQVSRLPLFDAAQSQELKEWFASLLETVSENARQLAFRLSVVRTGLNQNLINSLWHQPNEAKLLTRELINGCILQQSEDPGTFLLHDFIRDYLYDQLQENRRRKSHTDAGKYFLKRSQETTDENLQAEYLSEALFHFFQVKELDPIRNFALLCHKLLIMKGDRDRAQTIATYALEAARILKDDEGISNWLVRIAEREIEHDQLIEGGKHLDEALKLMEKFLPKLPSKQVDKVNNLFAHTYLLKGRLAYQIAEFSSSKDNFVKSLTFAREANNKREEVFCLIMIGHLARQKKEFDEAYQLFYQAGELAKSIPDLELENECNSHLGLISRRKGDFGDARSRFTHVYENAKKQGNRRVEQTNLNLLGDLYLRKGDYSKAEPLFREGLEISKKYGIGQGIRICMGQLAEVLIHKGEYDEAKQLLSEVEQRSEQAQDGIGMAWTLRRKGQLLHGQGNLDKGDHLILAGIQKLQEIGNEDYMADFEKVLSSASRK